jgi:hypothetical protein
VDYINVLKLLTNLVSSAFIDNIKYKFVKDIENVNDYRVIEIDIISQIELETTW